MFPSKTEDRFSLSHQPQKSKTIVKDVTLANGVGGRTDEYSQCRQEWSGGAEKVV